LIHFKVKEITEELRAEIISKLKITYIGHSMGGMTLSVYVIKRRLANLPHHLNRAALLSPAGFHENAPLFI
jgi:alpha-beta hydrolase superfamily lysophospholipase